MARAPTAIATPTITTATLAPDVLWVSLGAEEPGAGASCTGGERGVACSLGDVGGEGGALRSVATGGELGTSPCLDVLVVATVRGEGARHWNHHLSVESRCVRMSGRC